MTASALRCTVCDRAVCDCSCPDIDGRLWTIAYDPTAVFVMFKWCRRCDKHYARCACAVPAFFVISAGVDITAAVEHGRPNAAGGFTIPDLSQR